jgi:hypothetical protein
LTTADVRSRWSLMAGSFALSGIYKGWKILRGFPDG